MPPQRAPSSRGGAHDKPAPASTPSGLARVASGALHALHDAPMVRHWAHRRFGWREHGLPEQFSDRRRHAHVLMRSLGRPLSGGNRVDLLVDGPATYEAMFAAIDCAEHQILVESYIVEADGPGEELAQRLLAKARAGVEVNLLFDGFGSLLTSGDYFDALRRGGVRVCEYNPLRQWRRLFSRAAHLRDHRKLLVVDGGVAFVGGVNISGVYASGPSSMVPGLHEKSAGDPPWRDTHLRIEGPLAGDFHRLFVSHWNAHACSPMRRPAPAPARPVAGIGVRGAIASCDAGTRRNPFYRALLRSIDGARHRVYVTTAYFVPTRRLLRALANAARRGVDVRLLLPSLSDAWAPLHAGRSHYARLLHAGVRIYERQGALLHAKTTVIDGVWSTVGSANLDWRSVLHNAEANAVIVDSGFGERMEDLFRSDLAASHEVTLGRWQQRGWVRRLQEMLARRFEFLL